MSPHPTRREFIRTTALAAAGTPVLSALAPHLRSGRTARPLGFALVGLGSLSTNQIAPALLKTKNCRLAGIVTGTPAKAARWKAQYNIPERSIYTYDTMSQMADNPDIDVVYVVTPNALHARDTIKAAQAGKHVLCEKPMEVSSERCQAMIDACRAAGRKLAIGYRCQFDPHHLECARIARTRELGDVRMIEASFGFSIGDPTQWRLNHALAGGGPLMDVGIYALQATRFMTGEEPIWVSAQETKSDFAKFKGVEESMTWQLRFPGGVIAHSGTTYKVNGMNSFTVLADRGSFGMTPAYSYNGNRGWRSDGKPLAFTEIDQFAAEMDDFAQCITENRPSKVAGEEGLRDVKILMAIYESAKTGKAVTLA